MAALSDDVSGEPFVSVLWLCTGAATALAVFTLRRAYILTSLVLTVPGLPCLCLSAYRMPHSVCFCILECARVPGCLRLALFPLVRLLGYALYGSLSKTDVCFAMLAGLEPAPCET